MLLYIHIPFCIRKCHYCAFSSQEHIPDLEYLYLEVLKEEAQRRKALAEDRVITSVFLGGGTPTLFSTSSIARITSIIARNFSLASGAEFTIEANPETIIEKTYPSALKSLGVNRISLGVQSLDDEVLASIGREHDSGQALKAMRLIREAGFENFGLDMIWGLPGQTLKGWLDGLKVLTRYRPKHVSCYGLTLEPGTKMQGWVSSGEMFLPEEEVQAKMYIYGAEYLESEGILQYEVSNFARMGYACLHNTGYWEGMDFLGLGPSAVSSMDGQRWRNPVSVRDYAQMVKGSFRDLEFENLNSRDTINERVMLALRTSRGLNLKDYRELTGQDFCSRYRSVIGVLHKNNLIRLANGYLRLTKNGMLVSNSIIEQFIF
ncbi:radical SAM family heme chaperone HemW [Desulfonatronovibrio hydrogenovorans]|uniref:radical SAM family heme chaperone HemW n=1 Tax=Desulfonatronovibrio hydrogenovorans TaxID=53245 RepID=UPI00048C421C|nr:radical SAM family heme chaperone HemW [Desulfonatronovibrio hydrogenovorans]